MHSQPRKSPSHSVIRSKAGRGPQLWSHEPGLMYKISYIWAHQPLAVTSVYGKTHTTPATGPAWAWQTCGTL